MNLLDCHERLAALPLADRQELLPGEFAVETAEGAADCWPAFATAAVVLAGALPTSDSDSDLADAIKHFRSLLNIGVVEEPAWSDEARAVIAELLRWGDREAACSAAWN